MIQIIDGKRYNTETASHVADRSDARGRSDFRHIEEDLYVTKNGNWFLQYWGGAMTEYREECGNNSWCGGSGLRALTPEEAFEWLQSHGKAAALESHFADRLTDA